MRALALLILFTACSRKDPVDPPSSLPSQVETTQSETTQLYSRLLLDVQDPDGFLSTDECDSLLWSGLYGSMFPGRVNLTAAEDRPGHWIRRPSGGCGPISRDMIRGVLWWAWTNKQSEVLTRLWGYLEEHGMMADPDPTSIILPMSSLIARTVQAAGAECSPACQAAALIPTVWSPGQRGYAAHLQVLDALLESLIGTKIQSVGVSQVSEHWVRNPENPLYSAAIYHLTGSDEAKEMARAGLLVTSRWPANRLPDRDTVCDDWPTQREAGSNWDPCPESDEDYTTAGAAWLFVHWILALEPNIQ